MNVLENIVVLIITYFNQIEQASSDQNSQWEGSHTATISNAAVREYVAWFACIIITICALIYNYRMRRNIQPATGAGINNVQNNNNNIQSQPANVISTLNQTSLIHQVPMCSTPINGTNNLPTMNQRSNLFDHTSQPAVLFQDTNNSESDARHHGIHPSTLNTNDSTFATARTNDLNNNSNANRVANINVNPNQDYQSSITESSESESESLAPRHQRSRTQRQTIIHHFTTQTPPIGQPKKFCSGMNPKEWLTQYEMYMATVNMNTNKRATLLAYIDDECRDILSKQEYHRNDNVAYEQVKAYLCKMYEVREPTEQEHIDTFRNAMQSYNESVSLYAAKLKMYALKAFPTTPIETVNKYIIDKFCSGLANKTVKLQVLVQKHSLHTIDALVDYAHEYSKIVEETYSQRNKYKDNKYKDINNNNYDKQNNSNSNQHYNTDYARPTQHFNHQQNYQQLPKEQQRDARYRAKGNENQQQRHYKSLNRKLIDGYPINQQDKQPNQTKQFSQQQPSKFQNNNRSLNEHHPSQQTQIQYNDNQQQMNQRSTINSIEPVIEEDDINQEVYQIENRRLIEVPIDDQKGRPDKSQLYDQQNTC